MADDRAVPPAVAAAAKVVEDWIKGAPPVLGNAPRPPSATERFSKLQRGDKPAPMPPWKDPRAT